MADENDIVVIVEDTSPTFVVAEDGTTITAPEQQAGQLTVEDDTATANLGTFAYDWYNLANRPIIVSNEIPSGTIDGLNKTFTAAHNFRENTVWVFLNGLRQGPNDFTILGTNAIVFEEAPIDGDSLLIDYMR